MSAAPDEQEPTEPSASPFLKLRAGLRASLARMRLPGGAGRTPAIARPGPEAWSFPILIAVLTLVAFFPTLQNGFVSWDDPANLLDNPNYRGLSWAHLSWMFTDLSMGHYQPLSWVTLGLDYLVWGMNPMGYHLTSLILHSANAAIFYFIALRLLALAAGRSAAQGEFPLRLAAGVSALLFALHPLRVESAAWVTERRGVLAGLFFLLSVLYYLKAAAIPEGGRRRKWLIAAVVAYGLSLLSKAGGIALPLVLLVLDVYPLGRLSGRVRGWFGAENRGVWREKIPFLLLALGAAVLALMAAHRAGAVAALGDYGILARIGHSFFGLTFYLWKTLIPAGLSPIYSAVTHAAPATWPLQPSQLAIVALSLIADIAITIVLFIYRRRWPAGLAAWICYIILLAPVVGIVQVGAQIVADRYSYLSCLGWAVLLGGALVRWWPERVADFAARKDSIVAAGAAGLVLLGLGTLTWRQTGIWRDSERLWRHAAAVAPSGLSHYQLGLVLSDQGKPDEAADRFRQALSMDPSYLDAYYGLAKLLAARGELDEALGLARRALEIDPNDAGSHVGLGLVLAQRGELDEAVGSFRHAVELNPREIRAHNNLGIALAQQGDLEGAVRHFQSALEIKPWDARTHRNLANALIQRGDLDGAAAHLRQIVGGESEDAGAHMSLAIILAQQGNAEEASPHFRRALELNPGDAAAHNGLAVMQAVRGELDEAARHFREALRIAPEFAEAHAGLARVLTLRGEKEEAVRHYEEALRLFKSEPSTAAR